MTDTPKFSIADLKRLQAQEGTESEEIPLELAYHKTTAYIKPLKVKDKKALMKAIETKNEKNIQKNLDNIIEKYVTFDGSIQGNGITVQERFQILTAIRRAAAGDEVKIAHQCPECQKITKEIKYDLSKMYTKEYEAPDEGEDVITSSGGKIKLYLSPLTREIERDLEDIIYARKIETMSERQFIMLAGAIQKIEIMQDDLVGEVDMKPEDKIEIFENLDTKTLDKVVSYLDKTKHGVHLPFDFKCEHCGYHNENEEANITVFFIS
jgi:hypothetical protein